MTDSMTAAVKTAPERGATEIKDVPIPEIKPNEVLIRIKSAAICGTDVHIYNWDKWAQDRINPPLIYGHEFSGEIVKTGKNVKNAEIGDYVSAEGHIVCGVCEQCRVGKAHICQNCKIIGVDRDGIFTEYVAIPATNIWHNNPELPPHITAIQDPLGNAVHTLFSSDIVGKTIGIIGAGPIGLMAIAIAKESGVQEVFVVEGDNRYRVKLAESVGADHTYMASQQDVVSDILSDTDGEGLDIVLEMSGNPAGFNTGLKILKLGGEYNILGVYSKPVCINMSEDVVFKYVKIQGINGRLMYNTWYRMRGLLRNKSLVNKLEKIITHKFSLKDFEKAMETMRSGKSGKVVFDKIP